MSPLRKVLLMRNEEISADSEEVKGISKYSLSMLKEGIFSDSEKVKPRHTLLYAKAFILKLFRWKDQVLPGTHFSEGTQL